MRRSFDPLVSSWLLHSLPALCKKFNISYALPTTEVNKPRVAAVLLCGVVSFRFAGSAARQASCTPCFAVLPVDRFRHRRWLRRNKPRPRGSQHVSTYKFALVAHDPKTQAPALSFLACVAVDLLMISKNNHETVARRAG